MTWPRIKSFIATLWQPFFAVNPYSHKFCNTCLKVHFLIAHVMTKIVSPHPCRCETHPVRPGRWQEHQCRRPQARSWLGTGSLNFLHTARDSGISEKSGLKCMSNSNHHGDIFDKIDSKSTTTNFNLSTTSSLWYILPLLRFTLYLHLFKIKLVAYYL